jgi:hypothetical protein
MSLSYADLQEIRKIVEETVHPIKGELEALRGDIKEIYSVLPTSKESKW